MKVLMALDMDRDRDSGTSGWAEFLAAALERRGVHVDLLYREHLPSAVRRLNRNLSSITDTPLRMLRRIREWQRTRGPYDVIECWDPAAYLFSRLRSRAERSRTRLVLNRSAGTLGRMWRIHAQTGDLYARSWKFGLWHRYVQLPQERSALRGSDLVLVSCSRDLDFVQRVVRPLHAQIAITPPGVSDELFGGAARRDHDLLYVGTWIPRKGTRYLREAYALIADRRPGTELTIVGVGDDQVARVRGGFDSPHVRVIGKLATPALIEEYRRHRVLLFPSLCEGFGRVVLEAMAAGLGVVATDEGGASDLIEDGVNGHLVACRDAGALAARALELLEDRGRCAQLGAAATLTARGYTWDAAAARTLALYRALLLHQAAAAPGDRAP
ncbi:MAG: glycosyltransferase family 4 protein [Planctomycetota bacterium]